MFAESTPLCLLIITNVLYIYISLPRPFSFPISIILLYTISIQKRNTFSRTFFTFCPAPFLPLYISIIYTLYIERNILSRNFLPFPHSFIILLLYIEEGTLCPPPFSLYIYSYKVNTFTPPIFVPL